MSKITVYHKDYCPYCHSARSLLHAAGLEYEPVEVTHDVAAYSEMVQRSGRRTVPQIFFGDKHIGGYDDLLHYIRVNGELPALECLLGERAA